MINSRLVEANLGTPLLLCHLQDNLREAQDKLIR